MRFLGLALVLAVSALGIGAVSAAADVVEVRDGMVRAGDAFVTRDRVCAGSICVGLEPPFAITKSADLGATVEDVPAVDPDAKERMWVRFDVRRGPHPEYTDSDSLVLVESVCLPRAERTGRSYTRTEERRGADEIVDTIRVNDCRLEELGGGPQDRRAVILHEYGHTRGWAHGEGSPNPRSPDYNPAYHEATPVTGR